MCVVHGVVGSGLSNEKVVHHMVIPKMEKRITTPAGFEPALPKGNRFLIYRRNHLAMMSDRTTFAIRITKLYTTHKYVLQTRKENSNRIIQAMRIPQKLSRLGQRSGNRETVTSIS